MSRQVRGPSRRAAMATAVGALVPAAHAAAAAPTLDLRTPADHVRAFLKLHVSLRPETVYHLYTGTLDGLVPGAVPVTLASSTTVIRRAVEPRPEGTLISVWEATVYHRAGETEPLTAFVNPLNDREVKPFHQREGRGQMLWTDDGPQVFRNGAWVPLARNAAPFALDWAQAGERIWVTRQSSGVYTKNPLDPAIWPLEFSGELIYSEKTTNSGLIRELADPAVVNAHAAYALNQVSTWWPWLLMGRAPGFQVWNTQGVKLRSPDEIPAVTRALVEKIHPTIFAKGLPWDGSVSLWTDYPRMRTPVAG